MAKGVNDTTGGWRLRQTASPYLRQHAGNPVDWWPWSDEAIAEARRLDRVIFLSIGYSTCHWCHVMERESFEDPATAAIMNARFLNVKLDREERPDVDELYMTACQQFTRLTEGRPSGGWPLSAFLDPRSLKPFFVGTYFPPRPAHGRASFTQVLEAMADAWSARRGEAIAQATHLGDLVERELSETPRPATLEPSLAARAADAICGFEDRANGGFGGAPKFPQPVMLELLEAAAADRPALLDVVERALDGMSIGGLFDHVGGGFHRYAVDATWTVPHFEKMLYDNGQLATALARSLQRHAAAGRDEAAAFRRRTLRRTLDWMLQEMRLASGGIAAALDADTGTREGETYLWRPDAFKAALEAHGAGDLVDWARQTYGLDGEANFQDPHHPEDAPSWVLRLTRPPAELLKSAGLDLDTFGRCEDRAMRALRTARGRRRQPARDDKVLAGWNGLAIGGLAAGALALGDEGDEHLEAACGVADAVVASHLLDGGGDGESDGSAVLCRTSDGLAGTLEDHALLAEGLACLARTLSARNDPRAERFLAISDRIVDLAEVRFGDHRGGGWLDADPGRPDLFTTPRRIDDGAMPSGSGTMLNLLLDRFERTGDARTLDRVAASIEWLSGAIAAAPVAAARSVIAVDRLARLAPERLPRVTFAGDEAPPVRVRLVPAVPRFESGRAEASLEIEIDPPHHINAHDPGGSGDEELLGLRVLALGGDLHVEAEYPEGDLYRERLRVHARRISVPLTLRRSREAGVGRLGVEFQACTDRHCLRPMVLEVPVP